MPLVLSAIATQFGRLIAASALATAATVCREGPIVEAFPNAFLGVLMPEDEMLSAPKFKRGRRFNWLYERIVATGRLESLLSRKLGSTGCGLGQPAIRG